MQVLSPVVVEETRQLVAAVAKLLGSARISLEIGNKGSLARNNHRLLISSACFRRRDVAIFVAVIVSHNNLVA